MIKSIKYNYLILVFIFSASQLLAQTFEMNSKALNTYLEAEKAFVSEDYSEAFTLYKEVLNYDKDYDPALFQLARISLYKNQPNEALIWAEQAYALDSLNTMYAQLLVDIYKHGGNFKPAIEIYKKLIDAEPKNQEYIEGLAQLYTFVRDAENAIKFYDQLENLRGINEQISLTKRDLYLNSGKFDNAVLELVKLSEAFPENSQYFSLIAEMYMGNGEPKKAFPFYQKVLDINPSDPYIRITLADYYQQQGEFDLAFQNLNQGYKNPGLDLDTKIQILMGLFEVKNIPETKIRTESLKLAETLSKVHPEKPGSHAMYADLLFRDSLYTEAAREYSAVLKIDSSRYAVWEQLLFSLNNRTQTKEMIGVSRRAIVQFPTEPIPYLFNAVGHFMQDSTKLAVESLENGLPYVQNSKLMEQFYMYLGDAYYQNKQKEKAFEAYDNCLEINASNAFVLNNYAYYLALNKMNLDKAKTMAFTAISLAPNPTNHDTYGWVLFQLNDFQGAFKYVEMALKNEKNPSADVLDHMGDIYYKLGDRKKAMKYWKKAQKSGLKTEEFNNKIETGELK
jgi:tetratricopeptide (TPR) repeat protein